MGPPLPQGEFLEDPCPCCASRRTAAFHEVRNLPVESGVLRDSREEALGCCRGDVRLALCEECGFVWNTRFDPGSRDPSRGHNGATARPLRSRDFARTLVDRLIARYGLRGKDVLEIGCGKGEFLVQLCARGENRGVRIDPGHVPASAPHAAIRFIRDTYTERYADLPADLVCCRHTLEHVGPVADFLRTLRRSLGSRRETVVFFEVRDALRILRQGAFWDVDYERPSYFSHGSLARLLRACGFDLLDLYRDCWDQDLYLEAKPRVESALPPPCLLEEDIETLDLAVDQFEEASARNLERWRAFFAESVRLARRVAVWGSGSKGVAFLSTLRLGLEAVSCVVDIDPHRQGKWIPGTGHPVVSPRALPGLRPDAVVVMDPVYLEEIRGTLEGVGLNPPLLAA